MTAMTKQERVLVELIITVLEDIPGGEYQELLNSAIDSLTEFGVLSAPGQSDETEVK